MSSQQVQNFLALKTKGWAPKPVAADAWARMTVEATKRDTKTQNQQLVDLDGLVAVLMASDGMTEEEATRNANAYFKATDLAKKGLVCIAPALRDWQRMQAFKALRMIRDSGEESKMDLATLTKKLVNQLGDRAEDMAKQMFKFHGGVDTLTLEDCAKFWFVTQLVLNDNKRSRAGRLVVPVSVMTDSYKAGHFMMYPEAQFMSAYGEFRRPFEKDYTDTRFVFYGMRYIIENYIGVQWTEDDVEKADMFYKSHNAGGTPYPFPKALFLKFVREHNGYFPVKIEALPEGTCCNFHVPVYQIIAEGEYARLITFLETIMTQIWYPSNVATLSRRTKDIISDAFDKSVDEELHWLLMSRLHDFGFRGASCVEASIVGGSAHLLNFEGSDTMSAAYYTQFVLNNGNPVASSIPATEHSVMTSWPNEKLAIQNMIDKFGGENAIFACVMDSYDYTNALEKVLGDVAERHKKKGGLMVLRPDSGDPVECILQALVAGEKHFGATKNAKGYKMLQGVAAIQGDGINHVTVGKILEAVLEAGYSAQNVAFGMGAGLLQKHNRDTMSFATKLSYIVYPDGTERLVMKKPKTDGGKISFPGLLKVKREGDNLTIYPRERSDAVDPDNVLKVVYDHGPIPGVWDDFSTIRARVAEQWPKVNKTHDAVSEPLKERIAAWVKNHNETYEATLE